MALTGLLHTGEAGYGKLVMDSWLTGGPCPTTDRDFTGLYQRSVAYVPVASLWVLDGGRLRKGCSNALKIVGQPRPRALAASSVILL